MRLHMACSLAVALLAASPAMADPAAAPATTPGAAATSPAASDADNDPVICHNDEVTGSRLGSTRVCARQSVWERRREHDRQQMEEIQSRGNATSGGG